MNIVGIQIFERLPRHPIVSTPQVVDVVGTSKLTAVRAIPVLEGARVLVEATGKKRDRS